MLAQPEKLVFWENKGLPTKRLQFILHIHPDAVDISHISIYLKAVNFIELGYSREPLGPSELPHSF